MNDPISGSKDDQPVIGQDAFSSGSSDASTVMAGGRALRKAPWVLRVASTLVDALFTLPFVFLLAMVGGLSAQEGDAGNEAEVGAGVGLLALIYLALLIFGLYQLYLQGKTGSTWGKKIVGVAIVREDNARPLGFWLTFGRHLLHFLDGIFYIGYLWPLWDRKGQTFADKIVTSLAVRTK